MENIKFEVTEQDIKEYLKFHKEDEKIKYRETLFVKYMKEHGILTKEALEILIKKYNNEDNHEFGYDLQSFKSTINSIFIFSPYSRIQNLDLSGICHILIPTIRYYDWDRPCITTGRLYAELGMVANRLNVSMNNPYDVLESTLDDYRICGKIEIEKEFINFKLGREHSRKELIAYEDYYDEVKVKRIRKLIREGVNKYVQGIK